MGTVNLLLVFVVGAACMAVQQLRMWRGHLLVAMRGQGLVEYALILSLVALVVIGILTTLGGQTSQVFDQVNCTLSGGKYHQDNGNGNSGKCK